MSLSDVAGRLLEARKPKLSRAVQQTTPRLDPDEYPPIRGMEGPFRFKSGRVLYYSPREGRYYDSRSDVFLDVNVDPMRESDDEIGEAVAEIRLPVLAKIANLSDIKGLRASQDKAVRAVLALLPKGWGFVSTRTGTTPRDVKSLDSGAIHKADADGGKLHVVRLRPNAMNPGGSLVVAFLSDDGDRKASFMSVFVSGSPVEEGRVQEAAPDFASLPYPDAVFERATRGRALTRIVKAFGAKRAEFVASAREHARRNVSVSASDVREFRAMVPSRLKPRVQRVDDDGITMEVSWAVAAGVGTRTLYGLLVREDQRRVVDIVFVEIALDGIADPDAVQEAASNESLRPCSCASRGVNESKDEISQRLLDDLPVRLAGISKSGRRQALKREVERVLKDYEPVDLLSWQDETVADDDPEIDPASVKRLSGMAKLRGPGVVNVSKPDVGFENDAWWSFDAKTRMLHGYAERVRVGHDVATVASTYVRFRVGQPWLAESACCSACAKGAKVEVEDDDDVVEEVTMSDVGSLAMPFRDDEDDDVSSGND